MISSIQANISIIGAQKNYEGLWSGLVDFVMVYSIRDIRVTFKDGTEIKA